MQILTVDIGTGTQDIFLYDSRLDIENGLKMIMPSPTMMVYRRLRQATQRGEAVCLRGLTMGGGPSHWAAEAHIKSGFLLFATAEAARSFNDDLDVVKEMGVQLVNEDEANRLPSSVVRLELRDFDFALIERAMAQFGVSLTKLDAQAVAVFDHGNSPPGYSDRQFRFDYLDARIRQKNQLSAFAYLADDVPPMMTRLQAVVRSAESSGVPLVVMDTAPAAVLGATYDALVAARPRVLIVNVGNFHTLAFRLGPQGIEGVFEHHTGLLDLPKLEDYLSALASGTLTHEQVFGDHGHGALIYHPDALVFPEEGFGVAVTGPRRNLMKGSLLRPYFVVPFGDMMLTGCFGLLAAVADLIPEFGETIRMSLEGRATNLAAPWDIDM